MRGEAMKPVPSVDPKHVIEAHKKLVADREEYGSSEPMISIAGLFAKRMPPHDVLNIVHRLYALANFLHSGEAKEWLNTDTGTDYILLNEAVLRAAARAPLNEAEYMKDMSFDPKTFMPIALAEVEAEGRA
jgi:hypothetical protein